MKTTVMIMLLAVLTSASAIADEEVPPRFRIAVEVTVPDDDLRERVTGYLSSELQNLRDVAVTSEHPDYKLFAMVMQVATSDDRRMAYVLSVSVAGFFPDGYFDSILRDDLANANEIKQRLGEVTVYRNQFMSLAGPTEANLQQVAKNVVAKFNYHVLGPERSEH